MGKMTRKSNSSKGKSTKAMMHLKAVPWPTQKVLSEGGQEHSSEEAVEEAGRRPHNTSPAKGKYLCTLKLIAVYT